jgi:hypothetical protein
MAPRDTDLAFIVKQWVHSKGYQNEVDIGIEGIANLLERCGYFICLHSFSHGGLNTTDKI